MNYWLVLYYMLLVDAAMVILAGIALACYVMVGKWNETIGRRVSGALTILIGSHLIVGIIVWLLSRIAETV